MTRRAGRRFAVSGAVLLAAGAVAASALGFGGFEGFGRSGRGDGASVGRDLPPATARVTRQTMTDTDEETGTLGYPGAAVLPGGIAGTITWLPAPGAVVRRGRTIYRVDDRPVVLLYGAVPAYRALGPGCRGHDVRELEVNLRALGYSGFTVDDTFTAATATAVRRWQKTLRRPRTGVVELGAAVFAAGPIRIGSVTAGAGQATGGGREVLRYTGTARQVTVRLDVSRQRLARPGAGVRIRMPDGPDVAGVVDRAYTVVEDATSPNAAPQTRIEALVSLVDPRAGTGLEAAVVTVVFTTERHPGVLAVPVAALVALAEGGYGVEVVDAAGTHYLPVRTGLFARGLVEVTGTGLAEGAVVGMPR